MLRLIIPMYYEQLLVGDEVEDRLANSKKFEEEEFVAQLYDEKNMLIATLIP